MHHRSETCVKSSKTHCLYMLPWQINSTLIIFLYLHLSPVFLLKRLIFQGFPTFEFSFLFKVSSQIFSYFLVFFPAILVNPLVKQAVFLLKRLIFQGFPTFEFSFLFKVSSQIFSYFLVFFPAILVNPLVKQASLPTSFFNYSLSDILLPLHHQNSHGCKCSRLH